MPLTTPFPGVLSVLVMDNARIHHGEEIMEMADRFGEFLIHSWTSSSKYCALYQGVRIHYLTLPYSPDLNPNRRSILKNQTLDPPKCRSLCCQQQHHS